jgi:hypothetical protein
MPTCGQRTGCARERSRSRSGPPRRAEHPASDLPRTRFPVVVTRSGDHAYRGVMRRLSPAPPPVGEREGVGPERIAGPQLVDLLVTARRGLVEHERVEHQQAGEARQCDERPFGPVAPFGPPRTPHPRRAARARGGTGADERYRRRGAKVQTAPSRRRGRRQVGFLVTSQRARPHSSAGT